jgi:hypothetical protein
MKKGGAPWSGAPPFARREGRYFSKENSMSVAQESLQ